MAAIYLIRHGQASWGKANYDELSELGVQQAVVLGQALRHRIGQPDHVICGAMRRHQQTALHTLTAMGLPPQWHEDHRWNEYDHIQLLDSQMKSLVSQNSSSTGTPPNETPTCSTVPPLDSSDARRQFQELFDHALLRWMGGQHDGQYSESWPDFKKRVDAALQTALQGRGETIVFTSGGTISVIARLLWQIPDTSWPQVNRVIANASITKLVMGRSGLHLSTFNDHSPFEGSSRHLLTYR